MRIKTRQIFKSHGCTCGFKQSKREMSSSSLLWFSFTWLCVFMLPIFISCFIAAKVKERARNQGYIMIVYNLEEFTSRHFAMLFIGASSSRKKKNGRVS